MIKQEWTITGLKRALNDDLTQCNCNSERETVKAFFRLEVKGMATKISQTRKLTPCELAIAQECGWQG